MTLEGYCVGAVHPSVRRPIRPGDLVVNAAGWPGRLAVVDVDEAAGVAELVAPGGARIRARLVDLVRVSP